MGRHQYRYWDGWSWTEHVADGGRQGVDPVATERSERVTMADPQGTFTCPFCLEEHETGTVECPTQQQAIPAQYLRAQAQDVPTIRMLFIGYGKHGKTCYLSSFLHQLYHGPACSKWPGFNFIGLTQDTLEQMHNEYVSPLERLHLPPRSAEQFVVSLVLALNRMPVRVSRRLPVPIYRQSQVILTLHDIGGEAYELENTVAERLPLIAKMDNLVVLIDLTLVREQAAEDGRQSVVQRLHSLLNTVYNAVESLGQTRRKGILIVFTKSDRMWGDSDYGPLSERPELPFPDLAAIPAYSKHLRRRSDEIGSFVLEEYPAFYNVLNEYFKPVRFASLSALGSEPCGELEVPSLSPLNVFDPLLWSMKMEGFL
jgi:hypothetical protein